MTDQLGQAQVLPYLIGLSASGYQFTLLSFEKKEKFAKSAKHIDEICKNHNIRWEPEFFSSRPPLLSKVYDSTKMKKRVRSLYREERYDFTHCRSYVAASASLDLLKKQKVPFLFDMRGFWVDERVDNGQWNLTNPIYKIAYKYFKKKEKKYFENSAHIISLTETGKNELISNYNVSRNKITVIPCCVDLEHFNPDKSDLSPKNELKKKLGIKENEKILTYLGSLGGWYLVDEMLDFFRELKKNEPNSRFLFITQDKKEKITSAAKARGVSESDIIVQAASRKEVPELLALSNWSIFFIKDAYSKKASSPTKQGEIMAMGIPVICNDIGDTGLIVKSSNAGIVVDSFTDEAYHKVIGLLYNNIVSSGSSIRNGAFAFFDLQKGVEKYLSIYKNIISD